MPALYAQGHGMVGHVNKRYDIGLWVMLVAMAWADNICNMEL